MKLKNLPRTLVAFGKVAVAFLSAEFSLTSEIGRVAFALSRVWNKPTALKELRAAGRTAIIAEYGPLYNMVRGKKVRNVSCWKRINSFGSVSSQLLRVLKRDERARRVWGKGRYPEYTLFEAKGGSKRTAFSSRRVATGLVKKYSFREITSIIAALPKAIRDAFVFSGKDKAPKSIRLVA